jgi:hypothetical protein
MWKSGTQEDNQRIDVEEVINEAIPLQSALCISSDPS